LWFCANDETYSSWVLQPLCGPWVAFFTWLVPKFVDLVGLKSNALLTSWYHVPFTLKSNFTCCTKFINALELCPWSLKENWANCMPICKEPMHLYYKRFDNQTTNGCIFNFRFWKCIKILDISIYFCHFLQLHSLIQYSQIF